MHIINLIRNYIKFSSVGLKSNYLKIIRNKFLLLITIVVNYSPYQRLSQTTSDCTTSSNILNNIELS